MSGKRNILAGIVFILLPVISASCTTTTNLDLKPVLDKLPETDKAPVTVGIYYSPQFASHEHTRTFLSSFFKAPIGARSVAMFDEILPKVFEKVVKVPGVSPAGHGDQQFDWIIEPAIEAVDFRLGLDSESDRYSVTYRFTVYAMDGLPVSSWTEIGRGKPKERPALGSHISIHMEDAAAKILEHFQSDFNKGRPPMISRQEFLKHPRDDRAPRPGDLSIHAEPQVGPQGFMEALQLSVEEVEDNQQTSYQDEDDAPAPRQTSKYEQVGVIPIRLKVKNLSDGLILVRESDIRLELPNNQRISPIGENAIMSRLESPDMAGYYGTAALIGAFPAILIQMAGAGEREKKRFQRLDDLHTQRFGEHLLGKGGTAQGFAYFIPAKGTPAFDQAKLTLWLMNPQSSGGVKYSVPVNGLGFVGAKIDQ